ncbi:MAG: hypothetical protein KGQ28_06860, partial [Hyphomicrobiales bacterium]|nr:hypothetical protein [Hyphomicrobiales bacterium]
RAAGAMAALGAISYPLYLLHVPVSQLALRFAGRAIGSHAPWSGLLFTAALSGAILAAVRWYDEPARAWLRRFLAPRPAPRVQPLGKSSPISR